MESFSKPSPLDWASNPAKNPENVAKFKSGNIKLLGFFVGQVLKATEGKANPQVVNLLVADKLK